MTVKKQKWQVKIFDTVIEIQTGHKFIKITNTPENIRLALLISYAPEMKDLLEYFSTLDNIPKQNKINSILKGIDGELVTDKIIDMQDLFKYEELEIPPETKITGNQTRDCDNCITCISKKIKCCYCFFSSENFRHYEDFCKKRGIEIDE